MTLPEQIRSVSSPSPSAANYPGLDEWRDKTIGQHPQWAQHPDFASSMQELNAVPPLVFAGEVDRLRAIWDGLLDGGTVTAPLGAAPWGGDFGMLVDRFGVGWMISIDTAS